MKDVEKKDEKKDVEKPDIPDVSGGLSYPDDGCIPEPLPWPEKYPDNPIGPIVIGPVSQA